MPQPLYPQGKNPQYLLDRRLSGSRSQPGYSGKEKIPSLPLPGIEPWSISPQPRLYIE